MHVVSVQGAGCLHVDRLSIYLPQPPVVISGVALRIRGTRGIC